MGTRHEIKRKNYPVIKMKRANDYYICKRNVWNNRLLYNLSMILLWPDPDLETASGSADPPRKQLKSSAAITMNRQITSIILTSNKLVQMEEGDYKVRISEYNCLSTIAVALICCSLEVIDTVIYCNWGACRFMKVPTFNRAGHCRETRLYDVGLMLIAYI